jgi:hypothetical protein
MGRHRPKRLMSASVLGTLGAIALITALAVAATVYARRGTPAGTVGGGCATDVRVVAAASFAPVIEYLKPALQAGDDCLDVTLDVVDGRAAPSRAAQLKADVWIPDDASWTAAAKRLPLAPKGTLGSGTVIATSPIFMVTDPTTADRVRTAGGSWRGLAGLVGDPAGVKLAVRDPAGSGEGLVAAGALGEGVWVAQGMDASSLALSRALPHTRTVAGDKVALPTQPGEVGLAAEYSLLGAAGLPAGMTYLTGADRSAVLRYVFLPTQAAMDRQAAVTRLLDALRGTRADEALAAAKLRRADTLPVAGAPVSPLPGLAAKPFDVLGAHHVDHVFATWYPADRRTSLLMVVDTSGSMASPAPGTDTPVIDLVRQGGRSLGTLLPDDARVGLWEFGAAYREVLPAAPLIPEHRAAWAAAVDGLAARNTGTGLYDTILAAYTTARDSYVDGMPNQVFVFTDGRDETPVDAPQLATALAAARDPKRPVRLSIVSYGREKDRAALETVVKAVDGSVETPETVDEVGAVFIHVAAGGLHEHES